MGNRWDRIIIHADMDAFYAAVEQRDNPELRGKPVIVGPNSYRGVALTVSYEARVCGVGSAMPMAEVRRRCPQAIVVSPRFDHYQQISEQVMDVLADFSPYVEALSLDEAFIDMSGSEHFFGDPKSMGTLIKDAVFEATHLNISVGISGTKYVAKVASAHNKPADTASEFMKLARQLLDEFTHPGPFRLVGMAAFELSWRSEPRQLDIFEDSQARALECTIDALAEKFGKDVVFHGRDLSNPGTVSSNGVNLDFLDYRDGERVSRPEAD